MLAISQQFAGSGFDLPLLTSLLFIFAGLAFKLSAVPFHFWLPDAFEGAAAEVAGFLSVASKAAAVGLTGRLLVTLQESIVRSDGSSMHLPMTIGMSLAAVSAITATVGNLMALPQTNLKRLLAYSTIAHAGIMTMALSTLSYAGLSATMVYLAGYLAMNLGAFAVVAIVRNQTGHEEISAVRGLAKHSPGLAVAFGVFLFSLLGLPPLAGFAGKFQVFMSVYEASQHVGAFGSYYKVLLAVAIINTAISAGVYLKVLKVMAFDEPTVDCKVGGHPIVFPRSGVVFVLLLAVVVLVLGVVWSPVLKMVEFAIGSLK